MPRETIKQAYMGPTDLAKHLGIGVSALWECQHDPHANFPRPHYILVGNTKQRLAQWSIVAIERWLHARHKHDPSTGCEFSPISLEIVAQGVAADAGLELV